MITLRPSNQRGSFDYGWLNTKHSFSFGRYFDPAHMGFRSLRVINDDVVAPGQGFGEHPHDNMEIVSYVISGALAHKDSMGNVEVLRPGEVQRMSAGTGLEHSEFNPSNTEPVHFIQIWIKPAERGRSPGYEQRAFNDDSRRNRLGLIVSPDGAGGSVKIGQDVRIYTTRLDPGASVELALQPDRHAWVQVVKGRGQLAPAASTGTDSTATPLGAGDGAAVSGERTIRLTAAAGSTDPLEALVFDLN